MSIKPIRISGLKTTNQIEFKCNSCNISGTMIFENIILDVDNEETVKSQLRNLACPFCGKSLLDEILLWFLTRNGFIDINKYLNNLLKLKYD